MASATAELLKEEGNECFRRQDYRGALEKYNAALGGENERGNGLTMGVMLPLLNNRAACYLEIADGMRGFGEERVSMYQRALWDADDAAKTANIMGGNAKALFRLGRATLGVQTLRSQLIDASERKGMEAAEALERRRGIAAALDVGCMHLRAASRKQVGDALITRTLQEAERLQEALASKGAPPKAQTPIPLPRPESFGQRVLFKEGPSWIHNQVALELPVRKRDRSGEVLLPMYLTKQENDHNRGELAIWMHYSDHLGEAVLTARGEAAYGEDAQYDVFTGNPYGNLSTPAQADGHIRSPDEFVLDFAFARDGRSLEEGIPAALVAAGVIERVRVAGHTRFGEAFVIYRAKF
jgi:tetratricopeptide (TPR) repeat protein